MSGTVIPCIDVMDGRVVQLVQGKQKALELESPDEALEMFRRFPLIHVIDLDAALGRPGNPELVAYVLSRKPARVGGGVRDSEKARQLIDLGAEQVIVGSAAFTETGIARPFLERLASEIGPERVIVAVDVRRGGIAIRGWTATLSLAPEDVLTDLEPYCSGFLCTCVDREGMMQGTDVGLFVRLRGLTKHALVAAGGISSMDEVRQLTGEGINVALGMAVYTGRLSLEELRGLAGP